MAMDQLAGMLVAVAAALGVRELLPQIVEAWRGRAAARAAAVSAVADTDLRLSAEWQQMVERLERRVQTLEEQLAQLQQDNGRLLTENATLRAGLESERLERSRLAERVRELEAQLAGQTGG